MTRVMKKFLIVVASMIAVLVLQTSHPAAQDDGAEEAERIAR